MGEGWADEGRSGRGELTEGGAVLRKRGGGGSAGGQEHLWLSGRAGRTGRLEIGGRPWPGWRACCKPLRPPWTLLGARAPGRSLSLGPGLGKRGARASVFAHVKVTLCAFTPPATKG